MDADEGSLVVKAYQGSGDQIGDPIIVDTAEAGAISEIAVGTVRAEGSGADDQLAVVYVRDDHDDQPDYGDILLQRYSLPSPEEDGGQLVPVGGDGTSDGVDAPIELTEEVDGDQDAYGRAPAVTSLNDGEIAVVWVEQEGSEETIKGCVIESDGDRVLRIDLTGLIEDGGITRGTKPTLLATGEGDIVVSWLQADGDDGYVLMAALYEAAGTGAWIAPEEPIRLRAFDSEPKDYSVTLSEQDGVAINVFWRSDSSGKGSGDILSQRFDIDGNDLGHAQKVASDGDDALPSDAVSATGLLDGQIVVVYAEEKRNGGVELAAHVIDTHAEAEQSASLEASAYSTDVDQEIAINVLADASGGSVSHINGTPVTMDTPIYVGSGWVQLRDDGWLTVSPDREYTGEIRFDYTIAGAGPEVTDHVKVQVAPGQEPVIQSIALDEELADRATIGDGLANAEMPDIVDATLYLTASINLDLETKSMLSIEVRTDAASTTDVVNLALDVDGSPDGDNSLDHPLASMLDTLVFAPGFGSDASASASNVQRGDRRLGVGVQDDAGTAGLWRIGAVRGGCRADYRP